MAMALAETGRFDEAAGLQRQVVSAVSDNRTLAARLAETLRLYERRQPCRTPWSDAEPMELSDRPAA